MNKLISLTIIALMLFGCGKNEAQNDKLPTGVRAAVVQEVIPTDNYSYLKVEEGGKTFWIAITKMEVKPGEKIYFSQAMEMKNFKSKSLDKTFESILFVQGASKTIPTASTPGMPAGHPGSTKPKTETTSVEKIDMPAGFTSVADLYKEMNSLSGKKIKVKGKVVKFNSQIMGKNWIHIQDGSNFDGKIDLLITSQDEVNVGDVVSFEGIVVTNKDFGAGYKYELLLENGKSLK